VGSGQFLKGDSKNATTADLVIRVSLTASKVSKDPRAELTITQGIAAKLRLQLDALVDPITGRLKSIDQIFLDQIEDSIDTFETETGTEDPQEMVLLRQFSALEGLVNQSAGQLQLLPSMFLSSFNGETEMSRTTFS